VIQARLSPEGEVLGEIQRSYDYLMVMQLTGDTPRFEESRIERAAQGEPGGEPLLVTSGFSTLLLVFHPYFQKSFEFTLLPDPRDETRRVDFHAIRGQRSPTVLRLEGRNYPILWKGTAWIDSDTGMVTRIETELGESMEDLGLNTLTAWTEYTRIRLGASELEYWLPATTTIEARSEHQYWRNAHRFLDYQLFSVESDLEILESEPEINE